MNLSTTVLSQHVVDAINNIIFRGVFPENAKVVSVSPVHKQWNDKTKPSNVRPFEIREHSACINNISWNFEDLISAVLQGSVVGTIFFCFTKVSLLNFADNNTQYAIIICKICLITSGNLPNRIGKCH